MDWSMDGRMDQQLTEWMDKLIYMLINERMHACMHGWMNELNESILNPDHD